MASDARPGCFVASALLSPLLAPTSRATEKHVNRFQSRKGTRSPKPYSAGGLGVTKGRKHSECAAARQEGKSARDISIILDYYLSRPAGVAVCVKELDAYLNAPEKIKQRGGKRVWVDRRVSNLRNWGVLIPQPCGEGEDSSDGQRLRLAPDWEEKLEARKSDELKLAASLARGALKMLPRDKQIEIWVSVRAQCESLAARRHS